LSPQPSVTADDADATVAGADVIAALKRCGIRFVVSLPDIVTSDGLLWPISRDPELRLIRVCKEDEGVSICAGLASAGTRSVLLIQHTGLFDSLNAVRAIAVEYGFPIFMVVGLQGMEPDREPPASGKYGLRVLHPVLDAMGIEHARLSRAADVAQVGPAFERAWSRSRPFVFLVGRSPQ
jgi:sulfopyruvate decarboxylase subunit alpha